MNRYFLKPGYILLTAEPTTIMTVLGSAVAVTLFDPFRKIGGMNHFVFTDFEEKVSPTALFAKPAITKLVQMFNQLGAPNETLEAHIFGGACPLDAEDELKSLGDKNVVQAEKVLGEFGISIIGKETGGHYGRKIIFNTASGEIIIAKVEQIRRSDWFPHYPENH